MLLFVIHIPQTVINKIKNYNQQEAFDTTAATQPHMSHCPGTAVIEVNLQDSGAQRLWRRGRVTDMQYGRVSDMQRGREGREGREEGEGESERERGDMEWSVCV